MNHPFTRKRRDPVEQILDAIDGVRAEAAMRAAAVRDAASDAADFLGEAAPESTRRRLPVAGAVLLVAGIAIAVRARRRRSAEPATAEAPVPSAAATAAKSTAAPAAAPVEARPAAEAEPEKPKEPQAATAESESASGETQP